MGTSSSPASFSLLIAQPPKCEEDEEGDDTRNQAIPRAGLGPRSRGHCHGRRQEEARQQGAVQGRLLPRPQGLLPADHQGQGLLPRRQQVHPKDVGCGVYYADGNGYYPDEKGNYAKDGEDCPKELKCHERCIRPEYHEKTTTTEECPKETTSTRRETTTTERRPTPKRPTSTPEECPKETTSTKKHYTTSTTTEECPKETTSTKNHSH